jgi:hypothetical protein
MADIISPGMSIWVVQYYTLKQELGAVFYFCTAERAARALTKEGFTISDGPRWNGATAWFHTGRGQHVEVTPNVIY